ncbi:MAG: rubrerythrin family protein, partial [Elusimicrobia bacterium]|nr:rubrerythrin family protein [Elusimicrobiota bacterium]
MINDTKLKKTIENFQKNELTEHLSYEMLARHSKIESNRKVLQDIAAEELKHYNFWKHYSGIETKPYTIKRWIYYIIATVFGVTFGIKLMEKLESNAQDEYT